MRDKLDKKMDNKIFFTKSVLGTQFIVSTTIELVGKGIKKHEGTYNIEYEGETIKKNKAYFVSKSAFKRLQKQYTLIQK